MEHIAQPEKEMFWGKRETDLIAKRRNVQHEHRATRRGCLWLLSHVMLLDVQAVGRLTSFVKFHAYCAKSTDVHSDLCSVTLLKLLVAPHQVIVPSAIHTEIYQRQNRRLHKTSLKAKWRSFLPNPRWKWRRQKPAKLDPDAMATKENGDQCGRGTEIVVSCDFQFLVAR